MLCTKDRSDSGKWVGGIKVSKGRKKAIFPDYHIPD
jgi:hypothetical protein